MCSRDFRSFVDHIGSVMLITYWFVGISVKSHISVTLRPNASTIKVDMTWFGANCFTVDIPIIRIPFLFRHSYYTIIDCMTFSIPG